VPHPTLIASWTFGGVKTIPEIKPVDFTSGSAVFQNTIFNFIIWNSPMKAAWNLCSGGISGFYERIYKYDNERRRTARDTCAAYNFVFVQTGPLPCQPN
jgi:hypothetical protein